MADSPDQAEHGSTGVSRHQAEIAIAAVLFRRPVTGHQKRKKPPIGWLFCCCNNLFTFPGS